MSNISWISPVIFKQTFLQMIRSRRTYVLALLCFLPVISMIVFRLIPQKASVIDTLLLESTVTFYLMFIVILVALFQSTTLLSDEIESNTIIYLLMRPISKMNIVLSKFMAYWVVVTIPVTISHLLVSIAIFTHPKSEITFLSGLRLEGLYLSVIILGLLAYGSIFLFLSVCFRYSALWGLLVAFGWEKLTLVVSGNIRLITIIHYLKLAILPSDSSSKKLLWTFNQRAFDSEPMSKWIAVLIILLISIFFLGLSVFIFQRKEYPAEGA